MFTFAFDKCDVITIVAMPDNPQELPDNSLRRLLPHRNRSLYKVHDTQGLAKLRLRSLHQG